MTRTPLTLSSTTVASCACSTCTASTAGWMLCEKRCDSRLTIGSGASAIEREERLRREQHHDDRDDHRQVGRGDRDHHDEALDLLQVAGRAAHQLTGLGVVVVADVQPHDVREQLLAQPRLGQPALAERDQAAPPREDAGDHCRRCDQARPEPQRLVADDATVDCLAGQAWHRHLAGAPQQTHHHAGDQPATLLAQQTTQQRPARRRRRRVLRRRRRRVGGCRIHDGRLYARPVLGGRAGIDTSGLQWRPWTCSRGSLSD